MDSKKEKKYQEAISYLIRRLETGDCYMSAVSAAEDIRRDYKIDVMKWDPDIFRL